MSHNTEQLSPSFRSEAVSEIAFEAFVDEHAELANLKNITEQLGARSLELMPFGVDMTVDLLPSEVGINDTPTNMGGHTDSCKDN